MQQTQGCALKRHVMRAANFTAMLVFCVVGFGILVSLALWQLHRLNVKTAYIDAMKAHIIKPPVPLPLSPSPENDRFLSVSFEGVLLEDEIHILTSQTRKGVGYRVIGVIETKGRRILIERGFVSQNQKTEKRARGEIHIVGNIYWPDEVDIFTPIPNLIENIWFARDVGALADALNGEPFLVIVRESSLIPPAPTALTTQNIPNRHLEYVVTWSLLAVVWALMSFYFIVTRFKH